MPLSRCAAVSEEKALICGKTALILPIGRLKKRVAAGRIELTGMMLNMSEIADEIVLAASSAPLR